MEELQRWGEEVSYKNVLIKNVPLWIRPSNMSFIFTIRNSECWDFVWGVKFRKSKEIRRILYLCWCWDWGIKISDKYAEILMVYIKSQIVSIDGALKILFEWCEQFYVRDSVGLTKHICKPNANYCLKHLHIDGKSYMPMRFDVQIQIKSYSLFFHLRCFLLYLFYFIFDVLKKIITQYYKKQNKSNFKFVVLLKCFYFGK